MKVLICDLETVLETIETIDRIESVKIIKDKLSAYMNDDDHLGWYYYTGNIETTLKSLPVETDSKKPNQVYVMDYVGERTEIHAYILA